VWSWLSDANIDPDNINLDGGYNEQMSWPHARLVRVRTNNAPKVIIQREAAGTVQDTGEVVRVDAPVWAQATMLRLSDTARASHVYLSFGSMVRKQPRGRSGYRPVRTFVQRKPKGETQYYEVAEVEPYTNAWSTPSALEIVVIRSGKDDPFQTAQLTAWLRHCYAHFGAWTTKPAPLFFESVLKQYVADFELPDDSEDANTAEDGSDDVGG
jgi:hypothetical protein